MSGGYLNVPPWMAQYGEGRPLPEDFERADLEGLTKATEKYFESMYPDFEPEIIYAMDKEYFLPALKVLKLVNGKYFSPGYEVEWEDMELKAECRNLERHHVSNFRMATDDEGNQYITPVQYEYLISSCFHDAPQDGCDCGIYGSVNLEEVEEYLKLSAGMSPYPSQYVSPEPDSVSVLCIIEPSPGAKVIMCRKGWKASHAFVSEFVGKTISERDTSRLLSIAWHREIDIRRLYENR